MLVLFRYLNMGFQKLNNTDRSVSVLREYQRNADDKLVYIRVTVILMLDMAKSVEEIEFFWGIDASTIYRYSKYCKEKGLDEYLKTGFTGYEGESEALFFA